MKAVQQLSTLASQVCFSSFLSGSGHPAQSPAQSRGVPRGVACRQPRWQSPAVCRAAGEGVTTLPKGPTAEGAKAADPARPDLSVVLGAVVSDAAVPEGHKGLHGFLYGDAGADVHDEGAAFQVRGEEDDGTALVGLQQWLAGREAERPPGVYAVYDQGGALQYIGYSRNLVLTLKQHRARVGPERTAGVRVKVYANAALVSRARLEEERQAWLAQQAVPPGNALERDLWEGTGPATAVMTEAERGAYEEKKLKMRKAMGENLYDAVEGEDADARTRRLRLLAAVEGDDWSGVIDGQTQETLAPPQAQRAAAAAAAIEATKAAVAAQPQIVSPFARPNAPALGAAAVEQAVEVMSVASVDRVLDSVRPYLIADGGNVEVVGVEDGIVALRLQGACGTCPSSTATMQMGLEAALKAHFGSALQQVVQVDKQDTGATLEAVNSHLDILRPAITNYGGSVEVLVVDALQGRADVRFKGPAPIGMGIQAAIKDKFPDIKKVNLVE